jgi:hypothetical protein
LRRFGAPDANARPSASEEQSESSKRKILKGFAAKRSPEATKTMKTEPEAREE